MPSEDRYGRGAAVRQMGGAAVVAALLGWVTLIVVARIGGAELYAPFAVAWAAYYAVAGLLSGLQHEVTRSVSTGAPRDGGEMWRGALVVALPVSLLAFVVVMAWGNRTVGLGATDAAALGLGFLGVAGLLAVNGVLAAQGRWRLVATLLLADSLTRLVTVAAVAAATDVLAWQVLAVSLSSLVWIPVAAGDRGSLLRQRVVAIGAFTSRALAAVVATGCTAMVVAGLPLLLALTSSAPLSSSAAGLLAALVLFRSPLLVLVNGLRPVLLMKVLTTGSLGRVVLGGWAWCLAAGVLGAGAAALAGDAVLAAVFGPAFGVSGGEAAGLVVSAALLAMLTVSGVGFVAVDRHAASTIAWALTLVATVALLLAPLPVDERLLLASVVAPLPGLLWHGWLVAQTRGEAPRLRRTDG